MNETETFEDSSNHQQHVPQWLGMYYVAASEIWRDFIENLLLASIALTHFLLLYIIIGALAYFYLVKYSQPKNEEKASKRVLFVIAHPDDECMFFGPTIISFVNSSEVYLLCLTIGNHYNKGSVRKEELYKSCQAFGIPQSNIMVMNNSRMPDNPSLIWNAKRTSKILLDHIETLSIEEVYTFDIGGVSGHLNHSSIFYGFAYLCLSRALPSDVTVYLLDSVNLMRKYSLFFDAVLSAPFSNRLYIVPCRVSNIIREAMRQHQSQKVWYRSLYIYLSRYMYINTYKELELDDVQLVLQMSDYNPML